MHESVLCRGTPRRGEVQAENLFSFQKHERGPEGSNRAQLMLGSNPASRPTGTSLLLPTAALVHPALAFRPSRA
jgi:hypothetical protein